MLKTAEKLLMVFKQLNLDFTKIGLYAFMTPNSKKIKLNLLNGLLTKDFMVIDSVGQSNLLTLHIINLV